MHGPCASRNVLLEMVATWDSVQCRQHFRESFCSGRPESYVPRHFVCSNCIEPLCILTSQTVGVSGKGNNSLIVQDSAIHNTETELRIVHSVTAKLFLYISYSCLPTDFFVCLSCRIVNLRGITHRRRRLCRCLSQFVVGPGATALILSFLQEWSLSYCQGPVNCLLG